MRKRIYLNIIAVLLLCAILLSVSLCLIFADVSKKQEIAAIEDRAIIIADLLNRGINKDYYDNSLYSDIFTDFISDENDSARMAIIAPDGTVLLDNKTHADTLENHSDREEFKQAIETGTGKIMRISSTFGYTTYYYAIKLNDGNILRISKPMHSIIGIFTSVLPAVIIITVLILLCADFIARRLTNNIVRPINNINFDSPDIIVYDELSPFIKKIEQQKNEINGQLLTLQNRSDTINAITENMKEGLILLDKNGTILSANISALTIFAQSGADVADKNIIYICRDMDLLQKIKVCLSGSSSEMSFERDNKIYDIYLSPVYHGGAVSGSIILFLDTTEKYKAEKQRKEFSANVSHELKTPLTTISALSEMIGTGMAKAEDVKGFANKISEQTRRLINIIDDIIRLSEFDEGNVRKEYSDFDLYQLADSVRCSLQDKADEKHVNVEIEGGHFQITANMRMIDELLYNLIDNGIKYNKDGGTVTVTLSSQDDFYKISVSDTGIGIPNEHLERVFQRFYRVDKSRSQKTGGTGLGLSIVKHISEYHKGRVEIESMENKGTTVVCFIK